MRCCCLLLTFAYAGATDLSCARCHPQEVAHCKTTAMARALETVVDCAILKKHPKLTFSEGAYSSEIERDGDRSLLTVTRGDQKLSVPLLWAFGRGRAGQTYVFEYKGGFYESRVSFFDDIQRLDLTMGAAGASPTTIEQAAGRLMDAEGTRDCFGCHSVGGVVERTLHFETLTPGIGCESCHGPASAHAAAMVAGHPNQSPMKKLSALPSEDIFDLCGSCHRTWSQIAAHGPRGVNNVRFQPYRLTNSKCYDPSDGRISCTACHDPHSGPIRQASFYDSKCSSCHVRGSRAKACSVAKANCVTCHMPKIPLPGSHALFTDHEIRIVRANEPYPN
jgi:hypothetical protein